MEENLRTVGHRSSPHNLPRHANTASIRTNYVLTHQIYLHRTPIRPWYHPITHHPTLKSAFFQYLILSLQTPPPIHLINLPTTLRRRRPNSHLRHPINLSIRLPTQCRVPIQSMRIQICPPLFVRIKFSVSLVVVR